MASSQAHSSGFGSGASFSFFGFHVPAFRVKRFSICARDTWHGWPDESTGAFANLGCTFARPYVETGDIVESLPP